MTVKQLKDKLDQFSEDLPVFISGEDFVTIYFNSIKP